MFVDALLQFNTQQAITATAPSVNTIDVTNGRDIGIGTPLELVIAVTTTFTAAGAATLVCQFQGSVDNATWVTIDETRPYAVTELIAGKRIQGLGVERSGVFNRYYRINYVVATGPFTAGALTSEIVLDRSDRPTYPTNI